MKLPNNPNVSITELQLLHHDLMQWASFCANFDSDSARDALQQTYLKVVEGSAVFRMESSLRTWLYGVIRITARELRRKRGRDMPCQTMEDDGAQVEDSRTYVGNDLKREIDEAIWKLTRPQRAIIYLAFYKEMTLSEIAESLDVSVGTVRRQYHRAKEKLKVALNSGGFEWKTLSK